MAPLSAKAPQLSVAEYFEAAGDTDRFRDQADGVTQLGFGLFGEVGGLLAALKKVSRDKLLETETQVAGEELGDALWYLVSLAHHGGVEPGALAASCMASLRQRLHEAPGPVGANVTFEAIDGLTDGVKAALVPVTERELRESGVATAAVTLQDGNRKYVPFYKTGSWYGDIQAFALDANGVAGAQQWSAESKLPIAASRNIFTWSNKAAFPGQIASGTRWRPLATSS